MQPGTRTAVRAAVDPQSLKGVAETATRRKAQAAMATLNIFNVVFLFGNAANEVDKEEIKEKEEEEEVKKEEEEEEADSPNVMQPNQLPAVLTPAGTQLMTDSMDIFPEMKRLHEKFESKTKGNQLLFDTSAIYPLSNLIDDKTSSSTIEPASGMQSIPMTNSTPPPAASIRQPTGTRAPINALFNAWLKSLPEFQSKSNSPAASSIAKVQPQHSFFSAVQAKPEHSAPEKHVAAEVNQSAMQKPSAMVTPGGTQLGDWDDVVDFFAPSTFNQPADYSAGNGLHFFRSAAPPAFRT